MATSTASHEEGAMRQTQDLLVMAQKDIIVMSARVTPRIRKDTPSHCAAGSSNSLSNVTRT